MPQFDISLKNTKTKSYRVIALLILIFNLVVFTYFLFYDEYITEGGSAIAIILIYLLMYRSYSKGEKKKYYFNEFLFFVIAFCWMGMEKYWLVLIFILLGILYRLALLPIRFIFSSVGIRKKNLPKKNFTWDEMSNVILKDNILTLDFKTNKIFQAEVEPALKINEPEFNSFAKLQLGISDTNNN